VQIYKYYTSIGFFIEISLGLLPTPFIRTKYTVLSLKATDKRVVNKRRKSGFSFCPQKMTRICMLFFYANDFGKSQSQRYVALEQIIGKQINFRKI